MDKVELRRSELHIKSARGKKFSARKTRGLNEVDMEVLESVEPEPSEIQRAFLLE